MLSKGDLVKVVRDFLPFSLRLGEDGELSLALLEDAELVQGQGLRMRCSGQLRWAVLGVSVPITIKLASVLLSPSIETRAGRSTLVFAAQVSHLDIALVPGMVDEKIEDRVNAELVKADLAWDFSSTLSHTFALPASVVEPNEIGLRVQRGELVIGAEALSLKVSFEASVGRNAPKSAPR